MMEQPSGPDIHSAMFREAPSYWWAKSRRELVVKLWKRYRNHDCPNPRILDAGCGTGELLKMLEPEGQVFGLDCDPEALFFCKERGLSRVEAMDLESESLEKRYPHGMDLITALDVLEHIESDVSVLKSIWETLHPRGLFIFTVPASPCLWSRKDVDLGHRRRYTLQQISRLLSSDRWKIHKLSYFVFFLSPLLWIGLRLKSKGWIQSPWLEAKMPHYPDTLNVLLCHLMRLENAWVYRGSFPWGASIVGVAEKNVL